MIKNPKYISINEVLSRVLRHPLMQDVTLEQGIQYTIDFIGIFGLPEMYQDKETVVEIEHHRGELPCDLISINQVVDMCTETAMRASTNTFFPDNRQEGRRTIGWITYGDELTFKVQNHVIFTSFCDGKVRISYKAIPVDEDGYPLLLDMPTYLKALELYIKQEVFTILFDQDKIKAPVLQNAQQQYAFAAGQLHNEFMIPSLSEMEAISRSWNTLIQRTTSFDRTFKHQGDREYLRGH